MSVFCIVLEKQFLRLFTLWLGLCLVAKDTSAQKFQWLKTENDTSYITDLTQDLTVRLYGSKKYTGYRLRDWKAKESLVYRPNGPLNFGFGFNYKYLGINFGFNLPFVNKNDLNGETKFIDL